MSNYHLPVLLQESVQAVVTSEDAIVVDLTFGGGGHSSEILKRLGDNGRLYAFDQDEDAEKQVVDHKNLTFIRANYRHFGQWLDYFGVSAVDAIFADLGVSSYQFDEDSRGFAYRFDSGAVDMRMNNAQSLTGSDVLLNYSSAELQEIFSNYGEVRNSKSLALEIANQRSGWTRPVSIRLFNSLLSKLCIGDKQKYFAQVYQAIRIEVNDEMGALAEMLNQAVHYLKPGGVLVVITYHSLEDRLVKRLFQTGNAEGRIAEDEKGRAWRPFGKEGRKFIVPQDAEMAKNPRARSAKLRIGIRTNEVWNENYVFVNKHR